MNALRTLGRFAERARRARDVARCEVCAVPIQEGHRHVVEIAVRRLLCACNACALAFGGRGPLPTRFRTVPEQIRADPSWQVGESELQALGVPVGLAFFFRPSTTQRWLAVFPSPAGATEAELDDGAWAAFSQGNALLASIEDDVEALLVHRRRDGRCSCFVVPVDACYELTALLRRNWRGIDGGDEARATLEEFFARLAERCDIVTPSVGDPS